MTRCQNPTCRNDALGYFRCATVDGPRALCPACLYSLNAMGMGWQRLPAWLERGLTGQQRGSDQTGRMAAA